MEAESGGLALPSRRFVLLLALGALPTLAAFLWPGTLWVALGWNGGLLLALAADRLRTPGAAALQLDREVEEVLSLSHPTPVTLSLVWRSDRPGRVSWVDSPPAHASATGESGQLALRAHTETRVRYELVPHRRGPEDFGPIHVRFHGPWGLSLKPRRYPVPSRVRVHPDLTALVADERKLLREAATVARQTRRRRQEGREFDSLRDYVPGDDIRRVDWKATARRGHPVTRQYRPERHQDIILVLDCGRHMRPTEGNLTRLDLNVNAALTLAHVALGRGDQVGVLTFDHALRSFLPPKKGREQLLAIVNALYGVQPTLTESDYHAAFDALAQRTTRRALVVTFTDLVDEARSRVLLSRLTLLRRRHLPLVVTLADSEVTAAAKTLPEEPRDPFRIMAARRVLEERGHTVHRLRASGVQVVDAPADALRAATLSGYLDVKASGRL